jgi:integrase
LDDDTKARVLESSNPFEKSPKLVMDLFKQTEGDEGFVTTYLEKFAEHAPFKIDATEIAAQEASDPKLEDVVDAYIATRPEKSRKADRLQLNKWLNDPLHSIPLKDITQYDAYDFFNELGEIYTKSSIRVLRAALSNVFVWAGKQRDLGITGNPFRGLDLKNVGKDGIRKRPFTHDELHKLFNLEMVDSQRDALTILVTTGMRSGELLQVTNSKVHVRDGIRYMDLTPSSTQTKNIGSKRYVPLHDKVKGVSFPLKFNQRSLNALVSKVTDDPTLTLHSLRHTYKDLSRDASVSKEVQDFITGHSQGDVASSYGQGPSIKTRYEAIMAIDVSYL